MVGRVIPYVAFESGDIMRRRGRYAGVQFQFSQTEADGSRRVRPRRGPTVVRDVWQMREGERIIVECNQLGQPIKKATCLLTLFLGTVARRPQLCPLGYAKWNDMLPTYKVELLRVIEVMN
ncbi:uncharacterized protein [Elaeis guineensis]|uniref:uncharacterized protein n=1 Tax=Elaeis guineensis var. tenera TaxID=51953 RepID=UPI003C6D7BBC